ncbi:MAG: hypothetical protein WAL40_02460, partial [Rhodoplanes sp.]
EYDDPGMLGKRFGQPLAEAGAAHVHRDAARLEMLADPTGRRVLLMQNDEDGLAHTGVAQKRSCAFY